MLVSLKNICKEYDNKGIITHALCKVSFDIKVGEFIAVMGPSGSGKSTLIMLLGFLIRKTGGQYFFQNRDVTNVSDDRLSYLRNQKIGFVFQPLRVTIHDNIKHSIFHNERRKSCAFIEKKEESLKAEKKENQMNILSNRLSDGGQRKEMIARMLEIKKALVKKPALILADEPVGGLDPEYGLQIMRILQELNNDGHTIVMVTRETYASKYAKRIIEMLKGRVKSDFIVKNRRLIDDRRDVASFSEVTLDCLSNKAIPLNTEFSC